MEHRYNWCASHGCTGSCWGQTSQQPVTSTPSSADSAPTAEPTESVECIAVGDGTEEGG